MRTETGPLKLGDDWTGYFMRGDESLAKAVAFRAMADAIENNDSRLIGYMPDMLRRFAQDLESVSE